MNKFIYLDNNLSTPMDAMGLAEMMPYLTDKYGNAVSSHNTPCCC
ncbi:hypothetical protein [Sphingobacterium sp. HMA12]|nr:hypothetical protein [Sphingobacterium sp. HMA12]